MTIAGKQNLHGETPWKMAVLHPIVDIAIGEGVIRVLEFHRSQIREVGETPGIGQKVK